MDQAIKHHALDYLATYKILDALSRARYNEHTPQASFIVKSSLEEIWASPRAEGFVKTLRPEASQDNIKFIKNHLITTISILVFINWTEWQYFWNLFVEAQRLDLQLPHDLASLRSQFFLGRYEPLPETFHAAQYIFQPVTIQRGVVATFKPDGWRLPFIKSESKVIGRGAYSKTTTEAIAPHQFSQIEEGQYRIVNKGICVVACKSFHLKSYNYMSVELGAENLQRIYNAQAEHKRIVEVLAMLQIGERFFVLQPLADIDLGTFLFGNAPKKDVFHMNDLLEEFAAIVDAVDFLHTGLRVLGMQLICIHMDLQPSHILVYQSPSHAVGQWKLSGFGIARVGSDEVPATRGQGTWQAPEVRDVEMVTRASDIWSLGVILFNVLAYGHGGTPLLLELQNRLMADSTGSIHSDECFGGEPNHRNVKPSLYNWLNSLKGDRLLKGCANLILDMLRIQPKYRPNAAEVYQVLYQVLRNEPGLVSAPSFSKTSQRSASLALTDSAHRTTTTTFSFLDLDRESNITTISTNNLDTHREPDPSGWKSSYWDNGSVVATEADNVNTENNSQGEGHAWQLYSFNTLNNSIQTIPNKDTYGLFDSRSDASDSTNEKSAGAWFERLKSSIQPKLENSFDGLPIKVAILDTGIYLDHPLIRQTKNKSRIAKRIDFVGTGNTGSEQSVIETDGWLPEGQNQSDRDEDGHGTHCAWLLLEVAPNVRVYVARVVKSGKEEDPMMAKNVAQAIMWAIAKEVDMISMSFGFLKDQPLIQEAIGHAQKERILLFAAASNYSKHESLTFPARVEGVFAIHVGNGAGYWSELNTAKKKSRDNICALGVAVLAPSLGPEAMRRVSGTSTATPIAAGIAALVVQCARKGVDVIDDDDLLCYEGMRKVFMKMADADGDNADHYKFLMPWPMLEGNDMNEILDDILSALKSGDG